MADVNANAPTPTPPLPDHVGLCADAFLTDARCKRLLKPPLKELS